MVQFKKMFKSLLVMGVLALSRTVMASSTDTVATTDIPAEHKVVELNIPINFLYATSSKKKKTREPNTLPYPGAICSGAFITDSGDILTARHCVDDVVNINVFTHDRRKYSAVVVATSPVHDLAIIHIDKRDTPHFNLAKTVTRGEPISLLGSPLSITDVLAVGKIARIDGDLLLLDCSALPGNSGGPIFNADQDLVGILTHGYTYGFGATHLNVAQGLDAIHFFLKSVEEKLPWRKTK